jgi:serine/threonine protein kinase
MDHIVTAQEHKKIIEHVSNGTTIARYSWGSLLGKGAMSRCYLFHKLSSSKKYAAKIIPKHTITSFRHKTRLDSEINIHKKLKHLHVVNFIDYFEDSNNHYILMELCEEQTLLKKVKSMKRLSEREVQRILKQLIDAIIYIHSQQVIHRDLKLDNLFISKGGDIKVGDFGLACQLKSDHEKKRTLCGTPNYISPEVLDCKKGHSYEADIWSIGVIIYTMLIGRPPFETTNVKDTYHRIRHNHYSFPERIRVSDAAKKLISKILSTEPSDRPSLESILCDPFVTNIISAEAELEHQRILRQEAEEKRQRRLRQKAEEERQLRLHREAEEAVKADSDRLRRRQEAEEATQRRRQQEAEETAQRRRRQEAEEETQRRLRQEAKNNKCCVIM